MRAWLQHHAFSLVQTLARLAHSPFATTLNVVAIGVALALPLGAYCVLANLEGISGRISVDPQLSVFLARDAAKADIAAIEARLKGAVGVRAVRFVSREAALAQFGRTAGMDEAIAGLRHNPLPDAFLVTLSSTDTALADKLELEFRLLPKVDRVLADGAWVRRLDALLRLGRTAVVLFSVLLGLSLVAVTFNTIRLQILTQRDEIELCRLIGATHAYIRRPFFYLGSLLGLLGGLAALAIVLGTLAILNRDLVQLSLLYGPPLSLRFPDLRETLTALAFSISLGWLGAYLSVSRHLLSRFQSEL
jgi:cell division transport system permease protein